jgi:hypothetical protein
VSLFWRFDDTMRAGGEKQMNQLYEFAAPHDHGFIHGCVGPMVPVQLGEVQLTITNKRKVWEFPKERFVTYESSDEKWARPLGFGREVEITETMFIPRAVIAYENGQCVFSGALATESPPVFCGDA